jgi:hypothetical protein
VALVHDAPTGQRPGQASEDPVATCTSNFYYIVFFCSWECLTNAAECLGEREKMDPGFAVHGSEDCGDAGYFSGRFVL